MIPAAFDNAHIPATKSRRNFGRRDPAKGSAHMISSALLMITLTHFTATGVTTSFSYIPLTSMAVCQASGKNLANRQVRTAEKIASENGAEGRYEVAWECM